MLVGMSSPHENTSALTQVLAVWGAATGSIALLWDFYKWKTSGPKLRMTVAPNMVTATPGVGVDHTLHIHITVTNRGTARTTLKSLTVVSYASRFQRWRRKVLKSWVVVDTGPFCQALPHALEVGEEWRPFLPQTELLKGVAKDHWTEFQLLHSAAEKPLCTRLVVPDEKPKIQRHLITRD
jgi:hypothetical protein